MRVPLCPPMAFRKQSLAIAEYGQQIYSEYGGKFAIWRAWDQEI